MLPPALPAIVMSVCPFPESSATVKVTLAPSIKFSWFRLLTTAPLFFTTSTFCVVEFPVTLNVVPLKPSPVLTAP
jgi:hypothetical protein